jgi:Na+:H+ antiporter, NhaA family
MKMRISDIFLEFFKSEKIGGLILVLCTIISLLLSNSRFGNSYIDFWHYCIDLSFLNIDLKYSLIHWINDGLMTIFFLLVGLEIERELYKGELSGIRNALLPIVCAVGGMIVPAIIHFSFNAGTVRQSGFGIPMATDIAFALGVLSLLGNRIPTSLKILLTALAIIDDLGAMIIIALFYSKEFSVIHFTVAMIIFAGLATLNRLRVHNLFYYIFGGVVMWLLMLKSGLHPTITGILLAFVIPFGKGDKTSPSYKMQHYLDKPVPFIILPIFALSNTCIVVLPGSFLSFIDSNTIGIVAGLVIGKPLGIFIFSFIAVRAGLCKLPGNITWRFIMGMGLLGGIGFTMSIFIANLAFVDPRLVENSKIAILCASVIAGLAGYLFLYMKKQQA